MFPKIASFNTPDFLRGFIPDQIVINSYGNVLLADESVKILENNKKILVNKSPRPLENNKKKHDR